VTSRAFAALAGPMLCAALLLAACTTPLERGEQRYQEGDRRGALALWREIPGDSHQHPAAQQRIATVEDESQKLVTRYEQRGRYFERNGRLAEAILSWRVVMKLEPEDPGTLAHVQDLSRQLATRKAELDAGFRTALSQGRLADARASVEQLRRLDPFDPAAESGERAVSEALGAEVDRLLAAGRRGFTSGDYAQATDQFHAVLALEPENESAQGYLSYIALVRESERTRPPAASAAGGKTAARGDPPQLRATDVEIRAEGFHQNALAAERAGDAYAAIRHDLRALAASPNHARARDHLAKLRTRLSPDVPGLIDAGRVAFQQEDLQSALDQWQRALLVEPDNERASQYAARAEKLLQNLEQLRGEQEPPRAVGAQR
jgi:tetratricopeptide (TPR) repeat protein